MQRSRLRETTLAHLVTALGVFLIGLALASGPLGRAPELSPPQQAIAASVAQTESPTPEPATVHRPVGLEGISLSARGGRGGENVTSLDTATPSPGPTDSPSPTPSPRPADPPSPTPSPAAPPEAPAGPKLRVGLQAGHWKNSELPAELAGLRGSTGAAGSGWREVDVNLDISRRVVALLEKENLQIDLIPATVPKQYKADAFVSVHGDANSNTSVSGYKLARATRSSIPAKDDALLRAISTEYAAATGLRNHPATITVNMTAYYAFANRGIEHSVAPTTPAVILELGFLTTYSDRQLLLGQPDRVAEGIAKGILKFLGKG